MRTFISYLTTPIFHFFYGFLLVVFHPVQVITNLVFGDKPRKKVVDILNYFLVKSLYIMGCSVKFRGFKELSNSRPIIIVSNHQSMYDIPAIVWGFRKCYPKFISKIELGKGLPSISYNLKYGKSALINRNSGPQSIKEIFKLGRLIENGNYAACIFPEGTRSKSGNVKAFKTVGIGTLLRAAPSAIIIPFVIDGHSQLMRKGYFPLRFGQKIRYTMLEPIEPKGWDVEELSVKLRELISNKLKEN